MRILYLTFDDMRRHFAGTVHIRNIVAGLRARGHRVMLVAPGLRGDDIPDWVDETGRLPMIDCKAGKIFSYVVLSVLFALRHAVRFRPAAIYCRGAHLNLTAPIVSWITGSPLVTEINGLVEDELSGSFRKRLARACERIQLRRSARIVTVCGQLHDALRRRYRPPSSAIAVVPNGADIRLFSAAGRESARQRLGVSPSALVVVYAGSFYREHGLNRAIAALGGFAREWKGELRIWFVGDGADRRSAEDLVRRHGLQEATTFVGELTHEGVAERLAAADVGLLLTVKSSSPVKLYEYMASSLSVVALVPSSEVADFIRREEIGLVDVLSEDEEENVRRIEGMFRKIADDAECRKTMGSRGRRLVEDRYNWDRASGDVDAILRSVGGR